MFSAKHNQHGAALVVGLMLLVVITVLAVSGMNTATTELAMARNDQSYENVFQAAETGLEQALAQGTYAAVTGPKDLGRTSIALNNNSDDFVDTTIEFEDSTIVPDAAFSLGVGTGIAAYHFVATSEARSNRVAGAETDRDSTAIHTQAFYVVGPGASSL